MEEKNVPSQIFFFLSLTDWRKQALREESQRKNEYYEEVEEKKYNTTTHGFQTNEAQMKIQNDHELNR